MINILIIIFRTSEPLFLTLITITDNSIQRKFKYVNLRLRHNLCQERLNLRHLPENGRNTKINYKNIVIKIYFLVKTKDMISETFI